ncbi:MAG: hypothetical protein IPG32_12065 [Saprospirales bacterium]|nr:hypothetical protein [Saprospirales bacterium]
MTNQNIQQLLDKYFEGETSLEEEAALKNYFQGQHIDPAFQAFQPLFRYLDAERQTALSPSFDEKVLSRIQSERQMRVRRIILPLARVAAVIAIILGVFALFPKNPQPAQAVAAIDWEQYEPETDEEAIAEATAALKLLASKLNGSSKTATSELGKIEKSAAVFK